MKRIAIATLAGLVFGFVCGMFACSSGEFPSAVLFQIIVSRTLMGFTIGISLLKMHWALHGVLIGFLYSIPLAISGLMAPENQVMIFTLTILMGMIYGLLTELITSMLFKAKRS